MISEIDLMRFKDHFLDTRQLEKDYLHVFFLYEIYTIFSKELVFKGGTALRIFYGLDRFSEDLNFTYIRREPRGITKSRFDRVISNIDAVYGISSQKDAA